MSELEKLKEIKRKADKGAEKFADSFDDTVRDIVIQAYQEGYTVASFDAMGNKADT